MTRILLAGVAVADLVFNVDEMPRRAEKYRARDAFISGGGNAANSAVAGRRLGAEALLAARVGDDVIGDFILTDLEHEQVDTSLIRRFPGAASSFSSIFIDAAGERQIVNFRGRGLGEDAQWLTDVPAFDALLADNRWAPLTARAVAIAAERGLPSVIDAEPPIEVDAIAQASHVAFSWQGLSTWTGLDDYAEALKDARDRLGTWVCVTDGANGCYYLDGSDTRHVPAIPVDAVDTLGAGDTWHAAFAIALAEGRGEPAAIAFANAAGSLKCTRPGGRGGAPSRAEVDAFMRARSVAD